MGRVFGPIRFLLPVCRLSWFLCTLKIYAHFSSHFSQQLLMAEIWYLVTSFVGTPYRGKHFCTHRLPTSCLSTLLIFIHIEHICWYFVAFFSVTIDGRNLIFGHKLHIGTPYHGKHFLTRQIPTSCLPKSEGIIGELSVHLVCPFSFVHCVVCPSIYGFWLLFGFFKLFLH